MEESAAQENFVKGRERILGWTYKTEIEDGIRLAYEDYLGEMQNDKR